jgi:hypothetical protein
VSTHVPKSREVKLVSNPISVGIVPEREFDSVYYGVEIMIEVVAIYGET